MQVRQKSLIMLQLLPIYVRAIECQQTFSQFAIVLENRKYTYILYWLTTCSCARFYTSNTNWKRSLEISVLAIMFECSYVTRWRLNGLTQSNPIVIVSSWWTPDHEFRIRMEPLFTFSELNFKIFFLSKIAHFFRLLCLSIISTK